MTPTEGWFYRQLARSREIVPAGVASAMESSPEIAATLLVIPTDGLRALIARILELDGVPVRLIQG